MPLDIRYARSGDVAIAYHVVGDGPTDLVLVPDFYSNLVYDWESKYWRPFYDRLARSFRLVLFDKRGTGLSDRGGLFPTLETQNGRRSCRAGCRRLGEGRALRPARGLDDGVPVCGDGPARAIRCGFALTSELRDLGLDVRVGVHTGECEIVSGKPAGIAVNTGARISAAAATGEVLVSSTVRDLVAGSGIEFEDRGVHDLKGVPGEWRLYAVSSA